MSKRSHSPHHRFSFKEPRLDCYKGHKLDKDHVDRRENHTQHSDFPRKELYPENHRRAPFFSDNHSPLMRYNRSSQEDLRHRRAPPRYGTVGYADHQTLSPPPPRAEDRDRHREGSKGSNSWARASSTLRFYSDYQQRGAKMDKRREKQGGGWDTFREVGPSTSPHTPHWESGWDRGRRNAQSSDGERQRGDSQPERSPLFRRQRRKLDDVDEQNGYRNKAIEEQRYAAGDKFGRDAEGRSGALTADHDHGFRPHGNQPVDRFDKHRDHSSAVGRRSFHPEKPYRASEDGSDLREEASEGREDGRTSSYPEPRRNPSLQGGKGSVAHSRHKGKTSFQAREAGGPAGPARSLSLESSQGSSHLSQQEPKSGSRPVKEENYKNPVGHEESGPEPWTAHRARSLDRPPADLDPDPKMPRRRMAEWNGPKAKKVTVLAEETLTIKVDTNQPVSKNSVPSRSADRQPSLDLVNVGRQRLDFLPTPEPSGTRRERPTQAGTFAQEVISLVHQVKERYFGGRGISLNERFSAGQKDAFSEDDEPQKLTLNQRFSSNRGFSVEVSSPLREEEPVFSRVLQPVRGPGDLRHDLERRRQERSEGANAAMAAGWAPRHPLGAASETHAEFREDEADPMEPEGLTRLPAPHRRGGFHMGPWRGGPHRPFKAFQRINYGVGSQFRLMRQQRKHNFQAGPSS